MVASSKGSMWIKRKCFHLSTTIDGPLWENCLGIECKGRPVEWSFYKPEHLPCPGSWCLWTIASQCYFWLGEHLSVRRSTSYVHCPTRRHVETTRYPIVWWRRLVKVWLALLLVYSMSHSDYGRFRINGGKQSLNRFSKEASRTGEIHLATGQFLWHPVLRVQWRSLMPGSSSILNKICFFISTPIRFPTEPLNRHAALLSGPPMAHGFGQGSQCSISLFRLE